MVTEPGAGRFRHRPGHRVPVSGSSYQVEQDVQCVGWQLIKARSRALMSWRAESSVPERATRHSPASNPQQQ